jgi:hypothetical protein
MTGKLVSNAAVRVSSPRTLIPMTDILDFVHQSRKFFEKWYTGKLDLAPVVGSRLQAGLGRSVMTG